MKKIADFLSKKLLGSTEDSKELEIISYAILVLLINFVNLFILLVISIYLNELVFFAVYIIFFIPLRVFCGGYHSKNIWTCFVLTSFFYVMLSILYSKMYLDVEGFFCLLITNIIIIIKYSPMESKNHFLSLQSHRRNKHIILILLVVDSLICIVLYSKVKKTSIQILLLLTYISCLLLYMRLKEVIWEKRFYK